MAIINGDGFSNNLIGTSADDTILGHGGDDVLSGLAGQDWIIGGLGQDSMTGGAGDDIFEFRPGDSQNTETVHGGAGVDTLLVSSAGTTLGSGSVMVSLDSTWLSSIERIWLNSVNNDVGMLIPLHPLMPSGFSPDLEIVGGAGQDTLEIVVQDATNLNLSSATFTNWQSDDRFVIWAYGSHCTVHATDSAD